MHFIISQKFVCDPGGQVWFSQNKDELKYNCQTRGSFKSAILRLIKIWLQIPQSRIYEIFISLYWRLLKSFVREV